VAETALGVEIREERGKEAARKTRVAGRIPGVLYGRGQPTVSITLNPRELERLLRASEAGLNTLIDLRFPDSAQASDKVVLVKEMQRDPLQGSLLHVDLYEVDLTQTVEVAVPIQLSGKPKGVEMGGVLDHPMREIVIECLPRAIPDAITVDVGELEIGDGIHVRDLALPEGVKLLSDPDLAVAQISTPTVEEAAPEVEALEGEEAPAEAAPTEAAEPHEEGSGE
jgi:large subunit ribosomal protein L25